MKKKEVTISRKSAFLLRLIDTIPLSGGGQIDLAGCSFDSRIEILVGVAKLYSLKFEQEKMRHTYYSLFKERGQNERV